MKVSVVVPAYNEEKYIKNCLDSLSNQEKKPFEIIVVDNNSKDKTAQIVKRYKNVTLIKEKRQGITNARNAGFEKAKGDIIARCDSDSRVPKDWIIEIEKAFENKKVVGYTNEFVFHDFRTLGESKLPSDIFYFFSNIILGFPCLVGPGLAIRQSTWQKVKKEICLDDKKVHEDIDLAIHIKKYGDIYLDKKAVIKMSARRIKHNSLSFFVEYPYRLVKMLLFHRHLI